MFRQLKALNNMNNIKLKDSILSTENEKTGTLEQKQQGMAQNGQSPQQSAETNMQASMNEYYEANKDSFNSSQQNLLKEVTAETASRIQLFQGPPGTGKTHTILGIVSMLICSGAQKKILICTPSNKAIDEIVMRLSL